MSGFRLSFIAAAVLSAVFLSACSIFHAPRKITLTPADSGKTLDLRVGDTITVALPGNATTGFDWYPRRGAGHVQILSEKGDRYEVDKSGALLAGAGGVHYFFYRVIGPGSCGIAIEYKRLWEKDTPPEQTFDVMIRAVGDPEEAASDPRDFPPEDQPVPMTDSKGNVSLRPSAL